MQGLQCCCCQVPALSITTYTVPQVAAVVLKELLEASKSTSSSFEVSVCYKPIVFQQPACHCCLLTT